MTSPSQDIGKSGYVRGMFERIVPRYDLLNCLISGGQDRRWRRKLAQATISAGEGPVLDVATGTGSQALSLVEQGSTKVVGVDFTAPMLARAQEKADGARLALVQADALHLPFSDGSFAAATTSFAMRNVDNVETAFREMRRVVRPGGLVACLEISLPANRLFRFLFKLYFYRLVPIMGGLISGQRDAYSYLPHSLDAFLSPDGLAEAMRRAGIDNVRFERVGGGALTLHLGVVSC